MEEMRRTRKRAHTHTHARTHAHQPRVRRGHGYLGSLNIDAFERLDVVAGLKSLGHTPDLVAVNEVEANRVAATREARDEKGVGWRLGWLAHHEG